MIKTNTMKIEIQRVVMNDERTLGGMFINGQYICDTLEDVDRHLEDYINNPEEGKKVKIYGQTAIPRGTYNVSNYWWAKHKAYYPWVQDVPFFSGILIHAGNTEKDSLGCILVGSLNEHGTALVNSRAAMAKVRQLIMEAEKPITITIY